MVDLGEEEWAAYFAAFNQQLVRPTISATRLPGATTI